ncbi:MAG: methyltransferase domain-containing protein [Candidatus Rokubacteria bacterium]|nr:methyltransferase domain-containing protein [Candidatus Rokubacteria bacterium]
MTEGDHVARNRGVWDRWAPEWVESGRRAWAQDAITWGMWEVAERDIGAVPDVAGRDVVELGCGTGYWSAWLARRGGRVVALDSSSRQLATARMLQREFGLAFPLVHGDAESTPFRAERFDVAISEYGAALWCDPYRWIPEAARLLRPGGELVFLRDGLLRALCAPDTDEPAGDRLLRDYFGLNRLEWSDDGSVNFALPPGPLIRLFRRCGFEILDYVEVQAPTDASSRFTYVTPEWARRWPSEEIWRVRRGGLGGS